MLLAGQAAAASPGGALLGQWMTEDRAGVVKIEPCGAAYCGRVVGVSDFPPGGLRDIHGAPQCGLVIIKDLVPTDDGRRHGTITNPDDGKTYDTILWVAGGRRYAAAGLCRAAAVRVHTALAEVYRTPDAGLPHP